MITHAPTCTEPGRWARAPEVDAPDDEILAYLQHCDACAYHARLRREEEGQLDPLLRVASRTLIVGSDERTDDRGRAVRDRRPAARRPSTARRVRSLAAAALVVLGLLAVASAGRWGAGDRASSEPAVSEVRPDAAVPSGQAVADAQTGTWYDARIINDGMDGRQTKSGLRYDKEALTAAVKRLPYGTRLRVVNPITGASVEVVVIDRGPEEGAINLSSRAATELGFDGRMRVLVEVLSDASPYAVGP